ncbi:MAG: hypothetical protein ACTJLK_03405 [Anaplasma sp.]
MKVGRITAFLSVFCASLCLEAGVCTAVSSVEGSASNVNKYTSVTDDDETMSAADLGGREGTTYSGKWGIAATQATDSIHSIKQKITVNACCRTLLP